MAAYYARVVFISLVLAWTLGAAGMAQKTSAPTLPATPSNPNEPVTAEAKFLTTPAERAATLKLLIGASKNFEFGSALSPDTILSVELRSTGSLTHEGSGTWSQIWSKNHTDWSSDFSGVKSSRNADVEKTPVPLRVQMARMALQWPVAHPTAQGVRAVEGVSVAGKPVTCVLVAEDSEPVPANARGWNESEYCLGDAGTVRLMSPVPGVYFIYDNAIPVEYAGHNLASDISVVEGSATVLQIHVARLGPPDDNELARLAKAKQLPGVLAPPLFESLRASNGAKAETVVIVHAAVSPQGTLGETEVIDPSGSGRGEAALAAVKASRRAPSRNVQGELYARVELSNQ